MAKSVAVIALQRQLFLPALLSLCLRHHSKIIIPSIPSQKTLPWPWWRFLILCSQLFLDVLLPHWPCMYASHIKLPLSYSVCGRKMIHIQSVYGWKVMGSIGYGNKGWCWVMSDNWLKTAGYQKQPQCLNTPTARLFPITSSLEPIA